MASFNRTIEEFELPGGELVELEVRIKYSISRFVPATRDQPAEGGGVEDARVEVLKVLWCDARDAGRILSPQEKARIADEISDGDELDDWCKEHAANSELLSKSDMY